ncbi:baseplate J/gp47 family protein [Desulfovibrio sp. OttesenSCG-928-G11]|nr:baseplate J/gp47 family protein [Desulfovibrio sp. OttesenSCG-928-G11]
MSLFNPASGLAFPANLPDVTFADADPAPILARLIANYEALTGKKIYPADPERLWLSTSAYELSVAYSLLDFTGKQNLLAYACGAFLDQLGAWHEVTRLAASAASCMQRFFAEPGLDFSVTLPKGLRVSPDNELYFEIAATVIIPAAQSPSEQPFADAAVVCLSPGEAGNGFLPGQISTLVDPRPYVAETRNITESTGGADVESDERFRLRIYLAPAGFSTAGPIGAYQYWAMTASQTISDVAVLSPEPCEIKVYPLVEGGVLPDALLLEAVADLLSPRKVRPMGDRLAVLAPEAVHYDISATYYLHEDDRSRAESLQKAVSAAVDEYSAWQRQRLGRDIVPEQLSARVLAAGAKRINIESPVFTVVTDSQVALPAAVNLSFGGFERA